MVLFVVVLYAPQEYLRLPHKRTVSFIIPEPDPNRLSNMNVVFVKLGEREESKWVTRRLGIRHLKYACLAYFVCLAKASLSQLWMI